MLAPAFYGGAEQGGGNGEILLREGDLTLRRVQTLLAAPVLATAPLACAAGHRDTWRISAKGRLKVRTASQIGE